MICFFILLLLFMGEVVLVFDVVDVVGVGWREVVVEVEEMLVCFEGVF